MSISRLLSLIVAGIYVFIACFWSEAVEDFAGVLFVALLLGLGCIWFGDELGAGLTGARFGLISSSSPGWVVKFTGWVILLGLPLVVFILQKYIF